MGVKFGYIVTEVKKMTDAEERKVIDAVARYVSENGAASLKEIAEAVCDEVGFKPSRMKIWRILQKLGKFSKRWRKEATE